MISTVTDLNPVGYLQGALNKVAGGWRCMIQYVFLLKDMLLHQIQHFEVLHKHPFFIHLKVLYFFIKGN